MITLSRAIDLDGRTIEGAAADIEAVLNALEEFKKSSPNIFRACCRDARDSGDFTLTDAIAALNKVLDLFWELQYEEGGGMSR